LESHEEHKNCDQEADLGNNCHGVLSQHQKHVHNQKKKKKTLLVYTLELGSVIRGADYKLIVRLSTYQHFEEDGGLLLTNGSWLSLHIYGNPGFKMGLLSEYMHVWCHKKISQELINILFLLGLLIISSLG
jgi:hypothetical protein